MSVRKTDNPENSYNIPHSKLDIDQLERRKPSAEINHFESF